MAGRRTGVDEQVPVTAALVECHGQGRVQDHEERGPVLPGKSLQLPGRLGVDCQGDAVAAGGFSVALWAATSAGSSATPSSCLSQ